MCRGVKAGIAAAGWRGGYHGMQVVVYKAAARHRHAKQISTSPPRRARVLRVCGSGAGALLRVKNAMGVVVGVVACNNSNVV